MGRSVLVTFLLFLACTNDMSQVQAINELGESRALLYETTSQSETKRKLSQLIVKLFGRDEWGTEVLGHLNRLGDFIVTSGMLGPMDDAELAAVVDIMSQMAELPEVQAAVRATVDAAGVYFRESMSPQSLKALINFAQPLISLLDESNVVKSNKAVVDVEGQSLIGVDLMGAGCSTGNSSSTGCSYYPQICEIGQYVGCKKVSIKVSTTTCTDCPAGYYFPDDFLSAYCTTCSSCPVDYFSSLRSTECTPCTDGTTLGAVGATACTCNVVNDLQYVNDETGNCVAPSQTPSLTPSVSPSLSVSPSVSESVTESPSLTPSASVSESVTGSITITPSVTSSVSLTPTVSPTMSTSTSGSLTPSVSLTPSRTPTVTPSWSPSPTVTPTVTESPTITTSVTPSTTPSPSISDSASISLSASPSISTSVPPSESEAPPSPSTSVSASYVVAPAIVPPPSEEKCDKIFGLGCGQGLVIGGIILLIILIIIGVYLLAVVAKYIYIRNYHPDNYDWKDVLNVFSWKHGTWDKAVDANKLTKI